MVEGRVITLRSNDVIDVMIDEMLERGVAKNQSALLKKAIMELAKMELTKVQYLLLQERVQNVRIARMMAEIESGGMDN